MGLAQYAVVAVGDHWGVLHDGNVEGDFATKESAFEFAIAAASLAIRKGHEVHVSVPGRDAGNRTALGAKIMLFRQHSIIHIAEGRAAKRRLPEHLACEAFGSTGLRGLTMEATRNRMPLSQI